MNVADTNELNHFYHLLTAFLREMEEEGFIRTPRQWSAIFQIIENSDTSQETKYLMAPLLCKTPDQQKAFYDHYDRWFGSERTDVHDPKFKLPNLQEAEKEIPEPNKTGWGLKQLWLYYIVTFIVLILAFGFWLKYGTGLSADITIRRPEGMEKPGDGVIIKAFLYFIDLIERKIELFVALAGLLIIIIGWRYYWIRNRKIAVQQERTDQGDTFWDFHLPHRLISFGNEFKLLAIRLRERVPGKVTHLDVPGTVKKTAKANGFLSLQYRMGVELPTCLMLIDLSNDNNHRAALFDAFYRCLNDIEVPVVRYFYRGVPRNLWNEDHPQGVSLETLAERYSDSRLFLLGDGWRLLNQQTYKPDANSKAFSSWEDRVLITPIPFPLWTSRERNLESLFVIAPFTNEGLKIIEKHLNPEDPFDWELQRPDYWQEEAILFDEKELPDSLRPYFHDPAMFEWLAALSFYPELNWNLTLFLGDLLSKKHGKALLTFDNLRQLSRIHWFYNGFIPADAREKLYKVLESENAKTIHARIAGLLQEQLRHKEEFFSAERDRLHLQILLHKAHAGIASKAEIKELRKLVINEKQDFLTARFTNRPKPWEWILPLDFSFLVLKEKAINSWWWGLFKKQIIHEVTYEKRLEEQQAEADRKIKDEEDALKEETSLTESNTDSQKDNSFQIPLKIFILYARADESFKDELPKVFIPLREAGIVEVFYDAPIDYNDHWDDVIWENLNTSHIILPLLSNDFFASGFIETDEFKRTLDRHRRGESVIIPIILRHCGWKYHPIFRKLQVLPKNEKPVVTWASYEEVWLRILESIQVVMDHMEEKLLQKEKQEEARRIQRIIEDGKTSHRIYSPELTLIKGGEFQMGDEHGDLWKDSLPLHQVTVSDFAIGTYPVTNEQFVAFLNEEGNQKEGDVEWINLSGSWGLLEKCRISRAESGRFEVETNYKNHPVTYVSWYGAKAFCRWLSRKTGKMYRLPIEAEWEFAARGGSYGKGLKFAGSNDLSEVGWYRKNSAEHTYLIGQKKPNELGLFDMSGNVWEWCEDWFSSYDSYLRTNPSGPDKGSQKVHRGGSWLSPAQFCRVADRGKANPEERRSNIGFRIVTAFR
ncbi:MAG: TIR domain-containing protein [Haliscomenobacteraceae bacterium CHB4]|nr:Hercynine oxygenase [Saprospiraceae bacterium]MCE7923646.1 TIR domain-containing protein [Haliscomenobacteraceae bacterium CHB4]